MYKNSSSRDPSVVCIIPTTSYPVLHHPDDDDNVLISDKREDEWLSGSLRGVTRARVCARASVCLCAQVCVCARVRVQRRSLVSFTGRSSLCLPSTRPLRAFRSCYFRISPLKPPPRPGNGARRWRGEAANQRLRECLPWRALASSSEKTHLTGCLTIDLANTLSFFLYFTCFS